MKKVYLIGVGPGDEDLITLKAVKAIKKCDVLLYDRLSSDSVLRYAKEDAEIYYCGKRPGSHYKTQEEINEMLVYHFKRGKTVGRIKGGDPYVFGRGGEEALTLQKENIEFEVISGITSPVAVLNYAGIPMTQRGVSQSFHVFTGMTAEKLDIDWESVSKLNGTLVFMMGLNNLEAIVKNLSDSGVKKDMPAAVIMKGTTSKQKKVIGTIENIARKVKEAELESPCIIAVGKVIELNEKLDWYSKKPLYGKNICITRSKEQSKELRENLLELGAEVTEINSISTVHVKDSSVPYLKEIDAYDYIVLSSVNSVNYFFDDLIENGCDIRKLKADFPAIGSKTENEIRKRGVMPLFTAEKFVMESLIEEMKKRVKAGDKILYPKSNLSRDILSEEMSKLGVTVDAFDLYKVVKGNIRGYETLKNVDVILFTSPSTVKNTLETFGEKEVKEKSIVAIGPITAKELEKRNIDCTVSSSYTVEGIIEALKKM